MDFRTFFDYPINDEPNDSQNYIFLPDWDSDKWDKLLLHTQTQLYEHGEIVIRVGDTERSIYIVALGSLEVLVKYRGQEADVSQKAAKEMHMSLSVWKDRYARADFLHVYRILLSENL